MGSGLANVLGGAATGFAGEAAAERQRAFLNEENRRTQIGGFLQKIALDDTAHPYTRQKAAQTFLEMNQTPHTKIFKFDPNVLVAPAEAQPTQTSTIAGQPSFTPPAPPPTLAGGATGPPSIEQQAGALPLTRPQVPTATAQYTPPPVPPGIFKTPQQQAADLATRAAAVTGATAGAEAKFPVMQIDPTTGQMTQVFASGTGQPIGQPIQNAFNPMMWSRMAASMHPVTAVNPDGTAQPALQDKLGLRGVPGAVYGQDGTLLPNAQVFEPSLIPRTTTESMNAAGAITRKTTPTPSGPTGGGRTSTTPPAPTHITGAGTSGTSTSTGKLIYGSPEWQAQANPDQLAGWRWAVQGQKPAGGAMGERRVLKQMQKDGVQPAVPVAPALQRTIQEQFVARNSAIGLIDNIMANKKVFDSLISSGKIAIASNPDGTGVIQRAAGLTDQEAQVAGDFEQLIEHANLLRGPLGATGFRGQQAWNALQAQRGKPLGDPRITQQVLGGMRDRLVGLNTADKMVLGGQGMSTAGADPYEGRTATGPNDHKIKWTGGRWVDAQTGAAIQ